MSQENMDYATKAALLRQKMLEMEKEYDDDKRSGKSDGNDPRPWLLAAMSGCADSLEKHSNEIRDE